MKILHVTEAAIGGTGTVIRLNILGQIDALGIDNIQLLVPDNEAKYLNPVPSQCIETYPQNGRNLKSLLALAKAYYKKLRKEKPDIVHLHSSFAGLIGRLMLILIKITMPKYSPKIIYCPHAFGFLMEGASWKKKTYALIEKFLMPLTDAVLCVGHFERDLAIQYGLPAAKLHVVCNGVPVASTKIPPRDKNVADPTIQLLFIGRLDYQKGFDLLLKGMKELGNEAFHLTVVGSAHRSDYETENHPNISYTGWVDADKIPDYIAACDALVMPSRWEGFAMVPLEAMMYGRALAASDFGAISELIVDGETGKLFPVGDVTKMVDILRKTSRSEWMKLGQAAKNHVEKNFSSTQMIENTIALYKSCL